MKATNQRGFSAVEIVIAIVAVAAISLTGYFAYSRMQDANKTPTASDQTAKATTPEAPQVNGTGDLDSASNVLDKTNVDASVTDSAALDSEAGNF